MSSNHTEKKIALTINNGSSSAKLALIAEATPEPLIAFNCANIGIPNSEIGYSVNGKKETLMIDLPDHKTAMLKAWEIINANFPNLEIQAVGHRMVHGGNEFKSSMLMTPEVEAAIEKCSPLAPLHNPANLSGYRVAREIFKTIPHVAVFDTAFHAQMPEYAKRYAVPEKWYQDDMVAKYGFHGTSFMYISRRFGALKGIALDQLDLVIAHLGNGASVAKIEGGKSVDTSMGLTPLDGCVMGTRSGNIDAGIIEYISDKYDMTAKEVIKVLNKESGLQGLYGDSNMKNIADSFRKTGEKKADLVLDVTAYRAAKIMGQYLATLKNPKAVVFTAGVGENDGDFRKRALNFLSFFDFEIDQANNKTRGKEICIATGLKGLEAWVIPTNEELVLGEDSISLAETGQAPTTYSFEKDV